MNIFTIYKGFYQKIIFVYFLYNIEGLCGLLMPYFLGKAIDGVLKHSLYQVYIYFLIYLLGLTISTLRRFFDTRIFAKIYANVIAKVIIEQHNLNIEISKILARSSLSSKLVEFFETDVIVIFNLIYTIFGSLIMLFFINPTILFYCLAFLVLNTTNNFFFSRRNLALIKK